MKLFLLVPLGMGLVFSPVIAQETNLPPDPFANLKLAPEPVDYAKPVDRTRGSFEITAEEGKYIPGDHFAYWNWTMKPERWGNYHVSLNYTSSRTKMGIQAKVGEVPPLKSYAPRTGRGEFGTMVLGTVYLDKVQEYPVALLTGGPSNGIDFKVKSLTFTPAPEGETIGQSIDGTIDLHAKSATTFSKNMRYEPKPEKNCLGFWTLHEDWAEWNFDISQPGEFEVSIVQGCGPGNGGSEVNVLVNGSTLSFTVEDTGGFQNWKEIEVGKVTLDQIGEQRIAIKPVNKAGKAVMDIQRVILTPVEG